MTIRMGDRRADAGGSRPRRRWGLGEGGLSLAAAVIVVGLVVVPLLVLLIQAFLPNVFNVPPSLGVSLTGLKSLFTDPYTLRSGINSLLLAGATAVLASAIGTVAAYLLVMTDIPAKGLLWGFVWLILIAPSFLLAQGWELLLDPGGLTHAIFGGVLTRTLLSPVGVMLVLSLKLFPFSTIAVASALEGLGQDVVHAARLSGAGSRAVWRRVLLPLVFPAVLAGGLIVFAEVLSDFGIAATLAQTANFPLATFAIYAALEQFPVNFSEAAATSLLLVAAVTLAQLFQRYMSGRRSYTTRWGGNKTLVPVTLGRRRYVLFLVALSFVLVAFGIPAGTTLLASFLPSGAGGVITTGVHFTWANYAQAWHVPYGVSSFGRSLEYGLVAASLGILATLIISLAWRRRSTWLTTVLQIFLTTAIAVPGIVLGAGYIFMWNAPGLRDLGAYGTPVVLGLAYIAGGLPYAVRVVTGSIAQVPGGAVDAARMSGARLVQQMRYIIVPMLKDTWLRVWLMLFTGVIFELPVSQLLYPPGQPTLAVSIVHQFHGQEFGLGSALTVMSTAAAGVVALGISGLLHRSGRPRRAAPVPSPARYSTEGDQSA
jgi:iron(III) transport system permease protein